VMLTPPRVAACLILTGLLTSPITAQEAAPQTDMPPLTLKVYVPKHGAAHELVRTLVSTIPGSDRRVRVVADDRSNSIVVQAPQGVHAAISRLLAAIDVPADDTDVQSEVIPLRYVAARDVEKVVSLQLSREGRAAFNQHPNSVFVNDHRANLDRVRSVLARLDVPRPTLRIRCWILAHDSGAPVRGHETVGVLDGELSKLGLTDYGVISEAAVSTVESTDFTLQQSFQARALRQLGLSGDLRLLDEGRVASLDLNVSLQLQYEHEDDRGIINLQSTLTAPLGHFVVAGLAPTGHEGSKPVVLVIRVEK